MGTHVPSPRLGALSEVEGDQAFEEGRRSWPSVALDRSVFAQRLGAMAVDPQDLRERAGDLYLAIACAAGSEAAVKAFKAAYDALIAGALRRMRLDPVVREDILQAIAVRLFAGERPRIESYSGKGPLGAWVRVLAVRVALDMTAQAGQELAVLESPSGVEQVLARPSPELWAMRSEHKAALAAALESAVATLPVRDKTILRLHLIDGLSLAGVGALYGVNRSTAMRWLARIRKQVVERLRRTLGRELQLTVTQIHSLTALYSGELSLSLAHVLSPGSDDGERTR